jgi:hypothetical protein
MISTPPSLNFYPLDLVCYSIGFYIKNGQYFPFNLEKLLELAKKKYY